MSGLWRTDEDLARARWLRAQPAASASGNSPCLMTSTPTSKAAIADIAQCALEGKGDHILATRFLKRFVPDDIPWAHVDLSSATRRGGLAHVPTEITGFGARFALPSCWIIRRVMMEPYAAAAGRLAPAPARRRRAAAVLPHTAAQFARAIVMPNLKPPVTTTAQARAYRERILAALPAGSRSNPDDAVSHRRTDRRKWPWQEPAASSTAASSIPRVPPPIRMRASPTSAASMRCWRRWPSGLPLLVHGEVTHADVDVFDREARFIDEVLEPLRARLPHLRIVFEHVTTQAAVQFVRAQAQGVGATITPQHWPSTATRCSRAASVRISTACLFSSASATARRCSMPSRRAMRVLPRHRQRPACAQHQGASCGCAGIYSAHAALELYAEVFEEAGALHRLEAFAS